MLQMPPIKVVAIVMIALISNDCHKGSWLLGKVTQRRARQQKWRWGSSVFSARAILSFIQVAIPAMMMMMIPKTISICCVQRGTVPSCVSLSSITLSQLLSLFSGKMSPCFSSILSMFSMTMPLTKNMYRNNLHQLTNLILSLSRCCCSHSRSVWAQLT